MSAPADDTTHGPPAPDVQAGTTGHPPRAAARIITRHSMLAGGAGLVPLPIIDFVGTTAVALRMLRQLAGHYDVDFFYESARSAISALTAGGGATFLAFGPARAAAFAVPGVGPLAAAALGAVSASAVVYALGRVFALHFSLGGSFRDFDPERFRAYFAEQLGQTRAGAVR